MKRWLCPIYNGNHWKLCLIKYELNINVFVSLHFFHLRFLRESDLRSFRKTRKNKYFSSQKNDKIFHIFDQIKVLRVQL